MECRWLGPAIAASAVSLVSAVAEPPGAAADVRASVFRIASGDARGSGFLVDRERRLVVTAAHVLLESWETIGNDGVTATREQTDAAVSTTAVRVWPEYDVALLRLDATWSGDGVEPLPVSPRSAEPGARVRALGFRFGERCNVYEGVVTAMLSTEEFAKEFGSPRFGHRATILQTDCTLNQGLSGGPVVTESGSVVGVSFSLIDDRDQPADRPLKNAFFAIDARHVEALLRDVREDETLSWSDVRALGRRQVRPPEGKANAAPPQQDLPHLSRLGTKSELVSAMSAVRNCGDCAVCDGTGTRRTKVRASNQGQLFGQAVYRTKEEPCPSCDATGLGQHKTVRKRLERLVDALSSLSLEATHREKALESCSEVLRKFVSAHAEGVKRVIMETGAPAIPGTTPRGAPIVVCGRLTEQSWQHGHRVIFVRIGGGGPGSAIVAMVEPQVVVGSVGDHVLAGGRLAQFRPVTGVHGDVPHLTHGFVVAAPAQAEKK